MGRWMNESLGSLFCLPSSNKPVWLTLTKPQSDPRTPWLVQPLRRHRQPTLTLRLNQWVLFGNTHTGFLWATVALLSCYYVLVTIYHWPPACKHSSPSLPCPPDKPTYSHRQIGVLFRKYLYPCSLGWSILPQSTELELSHVWLLLEHEWMWCEQRPQYACVFDLASCASANPPGKNLSKAVAAPFGLDPEAGIPTQVSPAKISRTPANPQTHDLKKKKSVLLRLLVTQQKLTIIYEHIIITAPESFNLEILFSAQYPF